MKKCGGHRKRAWGAQVRDARTAQEAGEQQSDGDERMIKNGDDIRKFSKEAMTLGDDVYETNVSAPIILRKVYLKRRVHSVDRNDLVRMNRSAARGRCTGTRVRGGHEGRGSWRWRS